MARAKPARTAPADPSRGGGDFEKDAKLMELFIDSAKQYVQLGTVAVVASVLFWKEVLGQAGRMRPSTMLIASWVCFLVAIGAGATYQYLAIKHLESRYDHGGRVLRLHPRWLVEYPGSFYVLMLVCFYAGAICFTVAAFSKL